METDDGETRIDKVMKKLNWNMKGIKMPDNWKWMKRLDFYIIKKFLGTYVFAIALIISIAVVFDFNEKMDRFISFLSLQTFSVSCLCLLRLFSLAQIWLRTPRLLRCSLPE